MLVFDLETDNLLDDVTTIHCIVTVDEAGNVERYNGRRIGEGLQALSAADAVCGHNIIDYDIPVIQKLYPEWKRPAKVLDTLVLSRVLYADMKERDFAMDAKRKGQWIPKQLYGRHSLEAWGARLGFPKDDYAKRMKEKGLDPWAAWNQEMEDYCVQDVLLSRKLYEKFMAEEPTQECITLEHCVADIIARQTRRGFAFDERAAAKLQTKLVKRKLELEAKLREVFVGWWVNCGVFTPKRPNRTAGYLAGVPLTKVKWVDFNPGSRQHIATALVKRYGWKPKDFTPEGHAKVDETILDGLTFPHVELLVEFLTVDKRLGQIAEGKEAWLRCVTEGRIHGSVNSNGAVTGRMTHSKPNVAQTPRCGSPYGAECRELFTASAGYVLVGCDAEGLELRCLGHFLARYDGGAYGRAVVEGRKEDGTDCHSLTKTAVGLNSRDSAKTFIYALLYGAGDWKLGSVVWEDMTVEQREGIKASKQTFIKLGKRARARLAKNFAALSQLIDAVKSAAKRGWLRGLDGRKVPVRSDHAALNTLLQGAGALVMKRALVLLEQELQARGYKHSEQADEFDYEFVAQVHDEMQMEVKPNVAEEIAALAKACITRAGESFGFRVPLAGAAAIGANWRETH